MTKKVLVATEKPFNSAAVPQIRKIVEDAGYQLEVLEKYQSQDELLKAVADANALIVRSDKITKEVIDASKELEVIVRAGAGYDSIDTQYAKEKGVIVENTPGQNSNAVGELVFGLLVFAARNRFNGKSGSELMGKKIGFHAFGHTARCAARIARGFGMEIYCFEPFFEQGKERSPKEYEDVTNFTNVEDLYKTCDIVSLHLPATPETKGSINYDLVKNMPKGGVLLNAARKEIIDEAGLLKLMQEREDLKYLTDIMPDMDAEYREKLGDRYFSTPKKMGAQTVEANINAGLAAAHQIVALFSDGEVKFQVNK